jgi:acyl-coenzyme A synthetase/AMP-(fatty) acid ligase
MIYFWARTAPHRAAIIQHNLVTTYQGLADGIESIAARLEQLNLDRDEPVAVSLVNPTFMLTTIFALLRNGHNVVPVSARRAPFLAGAGVRHMIYDNQGQMTSGGRNIRFDPSWLPKHRPGDLRGYRKRSAADASLIFFTSGTTGLPKKAIMRAAALDARLTYSFNCATGPYQKVLILPRLATNLAFNRCCEVLNMGKTACFASLDMALPLIELFRIEAIVGAPPQLLRIAELKNQYPSYRADSLKAIFLAGGKISPTSLRRIRAALCRNILNDYGATEAGTVGLTPFDRVSDGSGAIVFPWVDLQIVDDAGHPLPAETQGTIRVSSPQLRAGLKDAGQNHTADTHDGWFYPGDLGSIDRDGVLHLAGRDSDVINRGGIKVSGNRIEEILEALPEVREAAACAVPGPSGVEELWIGVVPNGTVNVERIKGCLRDHRDVQLVPDQVLVMDSLPRGDSGKVQKLQLKERLIDLKRGGV